MLRQAQHERKIFNNFRINPVRPEPVEGRGSILSPQIKKETYSLSHYGYGSVQKTGANRLAKLLVTDGTLVGVTI